MTYLGYIYTSHLDSEGIRVFIRSLEICGILITHLGKSDPPKKWKGSELEVFEVINRGDDLTNYTFGRDSKKKIDFDIQLHKDPRWSHDTVSFSAPKSDILENILKQVSKDLNAFIGFWGVSGKGKNQDWNIVHISDLCPSDIKKLIVKAEQNNCT